MRLLAYFFLVPLLAGCDRPATVSDSSPTTQPTDERAVCEAVFASFLTAQDQSTEWKFIAWPPNGDPPTELLKALQGSFQRVAPVSMMKFEGYPKHRDEGGRGVLLQIDRIEWIDPTHVKVDAANISGNVGGQGWQMTLEKARNGWRVVGREATWES